MASQDVEIRIKTAIDTLNAAQGVGDLKKSLRELKGLALETGDSNTDAFKRITAAIGETNDKIGDLNAIIKSQSGEPIENLTSSFQGLKGSITSLDFKSAKQQFGVLTDSAKGLVGQFLGGFNVIGNFNKSIAAGTGPLKALTSSFYSLGSSIAATGIGALAIAVVLLIANFDKLKESGGVLGAMFTAIGDTVQFVMDKLIELSDWLGLTDIKNQERSKNAIKGAQKERESIESRYDAEIRKAEAAGKSVDDLNKKKNAALAYSINQEIAQYEALRKSKGKLSEDEQKELAALYKQRNDLVLENQIIDIKAQKEKQDKQDEANKKAREKADEKAKKDKEAEERYQKEIQDLKVKFELDDRQRLDKQFTDALAKIKGNSEAEKKLRLEIEKDRVDALKEFDDKIQKEKDDKILAEKEKEKQRAQEAFELRKKELEDQEILLEGNLQAQLEFLDAHYQEKGMTDNQYFMARKKLEEDITAKNKEELEKRKADELAENQAKLDIAQSYVNAIGSLTDLVTTIRVAGAGKDTAAQEKAARDQFNIMKGVQIASTIISGINGVMNALSAVTTVPDPFGFPLKVANAIAIGVAAAANVAKIAATQFQPRGGGGGGGGGQTPSSAPTPSSQTPSISAGSTIGLGEMKILPQKQQTNWQKVYVVESDIRNTTNKVEVIENRSVLGS
jgi:hypothetical protein